MEKRSLGATGMQVSNLCLGTMMLGPMGNKDENECQRMIHRALDAGINFIDTADTYSRGISEEICGRALKGRREHVVLATKFTGTMGDDPNQCGASRRWIVKAVEDSLRRLGTDYIDLYQMHRFDAPTDVDEILFTLTELVRQGKIRTFGSSRFPADRIVEAQWIASRRGYLPFRCEQSSYSIFNRDIERFVLPACQRYGMGMIVFSPLDGGYLAGRYKGPEDLTEDTRIAFFSKHLWGGFDPQSQQVRHKLDLVAKLRSLVQDAGMSIAQLANAWTIEHPAVTAAIIGPRTMEQLEGSLPAGDTRLSPDLLDAIDALVPPGNSLNPHLDLPSGLAPEQRRRPR